MEPMEMVAKNWRDLIRPKGIVVDESNEGYGKFIAEPFERGFGITVGNSLRTNSTGNTAGLSDHSHTYRRGAS